MAYVVSENNPFGHLDRLKENHCSAQQRELAITCDVDDDELMLNVLRCQLTY